MGPSIDSPLFIIGSPRSGTTLLRLMITCHRNIVIPPECGFALWLAEEYGSWSASDGDHAARRFVRDVLASRKFETWDLREDELLDSIRSARPATYAELVSSVYTCFASRQKPSFTRWGDKNNYYLHHIADLDSLFPTASFVHIVRDPRSLACSCLELSEMKVESSYAPRLETELTKIVESWRTDIQEVRAAFSRMDAGRVTEVRFEDLVSAPRETLTALCDAIGEDFDPSMLEYHEFNRTAKLEPAEFLGWKAKTLEPPQQDRIDRYRRDLTAEQILTVEGLAGAELAAYGYRTVGEESASQNVDS